MNSIIRRRGIAAVASVAVTLAALTACAPTTGSGSEPESTASTADLGLITDGVLRVGTTTGKPYEYQDASGNWVGFEPELVADVAGRIGITKIEFVDQEFSTLLAAVANNKYDIAAACIGVTEERKKTIDYVADYNNGYLIFIAKPEAGVSKVEDLAGKRVGLVTGSVQEAYVKENAPEAEIVGFPDNNSAAQGLVNGTVDVGFFDTDTAGAFVDQYPQLTEAFKVASTAPCAWAIPKESTALKAALDKAMAEAIQDGTVEALTKKWLPDSPILDEYKPKP